MSLPADFREDKWLRPLEWGALVGRVLAASDVHYRDLFRPDGFAKPIAELCANPKIARLMESQPAEIHQLESQAGEHARDRMHVILGCIAIALAAVGAAYWIGG